MSLGKKIILSGGFMTVTGYISVVISFIGNLILARLLLPEDFGIYALASSIITFVYMLAGFGSQEAIVQNRDQTIKHFVPTAFWMSYGLAFALTLVGSATGRVLVGRYTAPVPAFIIVLSWLSFINSLGSTYNAVLERSMEFRAIAFLKFSGTLLSFGIAIVAAKLGADAWALIIREAVFTFVVSIGTILTSHYKLTFSFNWQSARSIWAFGWRIMVNRISAVIFERSDKFMLGTFWGAATLGQYSLAYRLVLLGNQLALGSINAVVFSAFSAMQTSATQLQYGFDRLLYWLCRLSVIMSITVLVLGQNSVILIYGEQWLLAGEVLQSMWLSFGILPIHEAMRHILLGAGYVNKIFASRMVMLAFFIPALVLAMISEDIFFVVWVVNLSLLLNTLLMFYHVSRVINIKWLYLLKNPLLGAIGVTIIAYIMRMELLSDSPISTQIVTLGALLLLGFSISIFVLEHKALRFEIDFIWSKLIQRDEDVTLYEASSEGTINNQF